MQIRQENGWSVPHFEQLLSGSCRPYFHVNYRDWDKIKTTIFSIPDKERHTFIDVGANIGNHSLFFSKYFKIIVYYFKFIHNFFLFYSLVYQLLNEDILFEMNLKNNSMHLNTLL